MSAERELPWVPASFVKAARKQMDFMTDFGDVQFLLVRIDDPAGELAAGLAATSTLGEYAVDAGSSLGMSTVAIDTSTVLDQLRRSQEGPGQAGNAQIPAEMLQRCYFIVPLRKRATEEATVMRERISVGRTRNHDIVLRDRSVSKFHAYFQVEEDTVFLSDAGSKNGTRIGTEKVSEGRVEVTPGAVVTIGSIEVVLCTADALWEILRG